MRFSSVSSLYLFASAPAFASIVKRAGPAQFTSGQPIDANGKGAPILGRPACTLFMKPMD
jgi:hypothetical protein